MFCRPFVAVLALLGASSAFAQPAPTTLPLDDPQSVAIHDAATAFMKAAVARDAQQIDATFAGDKDQRAMVDAVVVGLDGGEKMRAAATKRWPDDPMVKQMNEKGIAHEFEQGLSKLAAKPAAVDRDTAIIYESNRPTDGGMTFKKVDGAWRVTALSNSPMAAKMMVPMMNALGKVATDVAAETDAGKYANPTEMKTAVDTRMRTQMQEMMKSMMSTQPGAQPVK